MDYKALVSGMFIGALQSKQMPDMTILDPLIEKAKSTAIEYADKTKKFAEDFTKCFAEYAAITEANEKIEDEITKTKKEIAEVKENVVKNPKKDKQLAKISKFIDKSEKALDKSYTIATEALNAIKVFNLPNNSINFFNTPKGRVYVNPVNTINQLKTGPGGMTNLPDIKSLDNKKVRKVLKVLQEACEYHEEEFYLEPDVFKPIADTRHKIEIYKPKIMRYAAPFLKKESDPLPDYQDLSFLNPQYIAWLGLGWGPQVSKFFGLI